MATYFAVYLLTVICLLDLGMCIFYTDSKEHDYPRIGKRKKLEEYLEKGIFGHKYSPPISTVDTLPLREAILPSVMIFQHFDIDNDGFISADEFAQRMSGGLSYIMLREIR